MPLERVSRKNRRSGRRKKELEFANAGHHSLAVCRLLGNSRRACEVRANGFVTCGYKTDQIMATYNIRWFNGYEALASVFSPPSDQLPCDRLSRDEARY